MKKVACISPSIEELEHLRSLVDHKQYPELFAKINDPIALLSPPIDKDSFLKEALTFGWLKCGVEFKTPYNELDHGNFPEAYKNSLKKSKRIILNITEDHDFICECLESEDVNLIYFQ